MEAKEIVDNEVARQAEFGMEPSWEDFVIAGLEEGMRGVVEWAVNNNHDEGFKALFYLCVPLERWRAQLKVWFKDKPELLEKWGIT